MKTTWPQAAAAIARGETAETAAQAAGVSERTVRRWQADEVEFAARVNDLRAEMFEDAAGRLSALTVKAVAALEEHIDAGGSLSLRACKIVLQSASAYRQIADFEGRLIELEVATGIRRADR